MKVLRDSKHYIVEIEVDGIKKTLTFPLGTSREMIEMLVEIEKEKCRKTK